MTDLVHTRITARIRSPPGNVSPAKRHVASPESGVVFFCQRPQPAKTRPAPGTSGIVACTAGCAARAAAVPASVYSYYYRPRSKSNNALGLLTWPKPCYRLRTIRERRRKERKPSVGYQDSALTLRAQHELLPFGIVALKRNYLVARELVTAETLAGALDDCKRAPRRRASECSLLLN